MCRFVTIASGKPAHIILKGENMSTESEIHTQKFSELAADLGIYDLPPTWKPFFKTLWLWCIFAGGNDATPDKPDLAGFQAFLLDLNYNLMQADVRCMICELFLYSQDAD